VKVFSGHVAPPADDEAAEKRLRSVSAVLVSCGNRKELDFLFPARCWSVNVLVGTSSARYPPEAQFGREDLHNAGPIFD
jgi:hypothetical protein